jgi:hypothetical protein
MLHQRHLRHYRHTQQGQAAATQHPGPVLLLLLVEGHQQVATTLLLAALHLHPAAALGLPPAQVLLQLVGQQVHLPPCHLFVNCLVPRQGLGWAAAARAGTDLCSQQAHLTQSPEFCSCCCYLE